jgi:hypothetical protein
MYPIYTPKSVLNFNSTPNYINLLLFILYKHFFVFVRRNNSMVEFWNHNPTVGGSIPSSVKIKFLGIYIQIKNAFSS